jgi:hypothetical protein
MRVPFCVFVSPAHTYCTSVEVVVGHKHIQYGYSRNGKHVHNYLFTIEISFITTGPIFIKVKHYAITSIVIGSWVPVALEPIVTGKSSFLPYQPKLDHDLS